MSCVPCQVSGVMCQMLGVRCQVSGVRCEVSYIYLFIYFFYKVGDLVGVDNCVISGNTFLQQHSFPTAQKVYNVSIVHCTVYTVHPTVSR